MSCQPSPSTSSSQPPLWRKPESLSALGKVALTRRNPVPQAGSGLAMSAGSNRHRKSQCAQVQIALPRRQERIALAARPGQHREIGVVDRVSLEMLRRVGLRRRDPGLLPGPVQVEHREGDERAGGAAGVGPGQPVDERRRQRAVIELPPDQPDMDRDRLGIVGEEKLLRPEFCRFQLKAHRRRFLLAMRELQIGVGRRRCRRHRRRIRRPRPGAGTRSSRARRKRPTPASGRRPAAAGRIVCQ